MKTFTKISLLLLLASLASCGMPISKKRDTVTKSGTRQFATTDSTFTGQIAAFEMQAQTQLNNPNFKVTDIPINFGDPENEEFAGVCFVYPDGKKEIIIQKDTWNNINYVQKQVLIFHELGHCALGRSHDDETQTIDGKKFKTSIMNSVIPSSEDYNAYEKGYLEELFTYSKTALINAVKGLTNNTASL